jgi:hypothetical protein
MEQTAIQLDGKRILIQGKLARIARLEEEWYEDLDNPEELIRSLRQSRHRPDILTFWQRLPDIVPKHHFCMEHDSIAAIPIKDYSFWWNRQIDAKTRNMVRRSEKKGVSVRRTEFNDRFVEGMTAIFNETPVRQGKRFWHYGKDFHTLKREFSRFLFREEVYGAYFGDELVGFIMLAFAGRYAVLGQILSKIAHRDKSSTNALMAKAVERCAERGVPYLVYAKWHDGGLGDFKRHNGFERFDLPRYFVPLTAVGRIFVALRLYRNMVGLLPDPVGRVLKTARRKVHDLRERQRL